MRLFQYKLIENNKTGARKAKKEDYDLLCMVMIGLGDHEESQPGTMLKMLDVLFSKKLETKEKKDLQEEIRKKPYLKMCQVGLLLIIMRRYSKYEYLVFSGSNYALYFNLRIVRKSP